jgi:hypothetical protein
MIVAAGATSMLCLNQLQAAEPAPKLLYDLDFEKGSMSGWRTPGDKNTAPQLATSITRSGKFAMRSFLDSSDPDPEKRERAEVVADRTAEVTKIGEEYWYGWSVYLASPWPVDKTHPELLTQFHNTKDQGEIAGKNPTLAFSIKQGSDHWTIYNRSDPTAVTLNLNAKVTNTYDGGPVVADQWTDWVVNVKWSYKSDGFLKIWRDGELIVNAKGPTSFNDQMGPHFKMGIYKSAWNRRAPDPLVKTRLAYHDEFRMAGADGSYEAVAPGPKAVRPSPPALVSVE